MFFHKMMFNCVANYFVWVKHGFTRVDNINSQNSKMWSAENSHALQENAVHLSKSWKWNGFQCSLKLLGSRTFSASAVITHCLWNYWCLWKYKNKINGLQCCVGTSCICVSMRSIFYNVPVDWYFLPWVIF